MKEIIGILIAVLAGIGIAAIVIKTVVVPRDTNKEIIDVIYSPKDSSWHLDIATDKDTVEVPVNAQTAAKFIRK